MEPYLGSIHTIDRLASYAIGNSIRWLRIELDRHAQTAKLFEADRCEVLKGFVEYDSVINALISEDARQADGWDCAEHDDVFRHERNFHTDLDQSTEYKFGFVGQSTPLKNAGRQSIDMHFFINPNIRGDCAVKLPKYLN